MATSLKLTRNQLASFLKDPEQIKQFERLILLVNDYLNSGEVAGLSDTLGSVIAATNANAARLQETIDTLFKEPPEEDVSDLRADIDGLLKEPRCDQSALWDAINALQLQPSDGCQDQIAEIQKVLAASTSPSFVMVSSKSDLPPPSGGVITLVDNYTYFFTTTVDLTGDRLVAGRNTTILGGSSENCRIKSTGLVGTALISSAWSMPMRNITIEANVALNLDASANANQALDWFGVNFTDCATIGTIKTYNNVLFTDCGFLNSAGLTFDGTIATVGVISSIFDCRSSGTVITLPSTATITRRLRIIYSSFVVLSGETGINVNASASIPVEGYILDTVNFSGGGTYTNGVTFSDNKALFLNCVGIQNSASIAHMTMINNATATDIVTQSVAVKVAGTTTSQSITQKFSHSNNRATYTGAIEKPFRVTAIFSFTAGNNNVVSGYIAKNGTIISNSEASSTANITGGLIGRAENVAVQTVVQLAQNDYLEVWVANNSANTDITVSDLSVIIEALS